MSVHIAQSSNDVLRSLSPPDAKRVMKRGRRVELKYGQVLAEQGDKIRYVYFVDSGLVSLLAPVEGHLSIEVGLIGREGMVGMSLFMGVGVSPVRVLVQGSGTAIRLDAASFRAELRRNPMLADSLNRFLYTFIAQVAQTAACNRRHLISPRLARWLLMSHDRMLSDEFQLTQAFLAHMLGVRRVSVGRAAAALQAKHVIRYRRGNIAVLNRKGLERASCKCYRAVNEICRY